MHIMNPLVKTATTYKLPVKLSEFLYAVVLWSDMLGNLGACRLYAKALAIPHGIYVANYSFPPSKSKLFIRLHFW